MSLFLVSPRKATSRHVTRGSIQHAACVGHMQDLLEKKRLQQRTLMNPSDDAFKFTVQTISAYGRMNILTYRSQQKKNYDRAQTFLRPLTGRSVSSLGKVSSKQYTCFYYSTQGNYH